ncbi:MAG TPA: polysaccharide biosynthesis tyrosine autokinase [Anaerolineales bacterium]|nr:polysaccharide biosynthesis tyrosine autokinase [Anaerolineales bacterium]
MEIRKLIYPLHKWWWLLLASMLVAALASFLAIQGQPDRYEARATLMIGSTINDPNPAGADFQAGEALAQAYAEIANRDLVRNATMEALGMRSLPQYVAQALARTQFLEIVVIDLDPARAQMVANELAEQLIRISPTSFDSDEADRLDIIHQQLGFYKQDIIDTQAEIDTVKEGLGALDSAQEIANAQETLNALQSKLNTLNTTYTSLLSSMNVEGVNRLTIIEPAALPSRPTGLTEFMSVAVAAGVGLILALGVVYLIEYVLDSSLKFPDDIEGIFKARILGHIFSTAGIPRNQIQISKYTTHPTAEAYRSLKTNMLFMGKDTPLKSILVASPDQETGKSRFTLNLAVSLAEGGKKVILVDADLRVPNLHSNFKLAQNKGLGEVLTGRATLEEVVQPINEYVSVVLAGSKHADGVEWLESDKMEAILNRLIRMADMVLIEGPPYIVSDSAVLGAKVDGVLAIVRPGMTKREAASNMAEQIERSGANLLGVALVDIPNWGTAYFAKIPNNRYYTA